MGDGMAGRLSAIGDGGKAAVSLMLDTGGMHVCIFESSQLEDSHLGTYRIPWGSKAFLDLVSEGAFSDLLDSRSF